MKLNRRQFLQGLAAGIAVAAAPPAMRAAVIEESKEHTTLPWGFVVRGRQEDLIMLPPGVHPYPGIGEQGTAGISYFWPQPFDLEELLETDLKQPIELCPWRPYRAAMESLIPDDLKWASRNYRRR